MFKATASIETLLISRRVYSAQAARKKAIAIGSSSTTVGKEVSEEKKDVFWMRDPKTGYWIPETHFNEVDVAELREKFLPKKPNEH